MDKDLEIEFGIDEVVPTSKTVQGVQIPLSKLDDPFFQLEKSDPKAGVNVERQALINDVIGPHDSSDPIYELIKVTKTEKENDAALELMLKAGGEAGRKLRTLAKSGHTLEEGMRAMLKNWAEFFSAEDQSLLDKAIKSLDLSAFFEIFNNRVVGA